MLIIFDVDDTLVDSTLLIKAREEAHNTAIAARYGIEKSTAVQLLHKARDENKAINKFATLDAMLRLGFSRAEYNSIMESVPIEDNVALFEGVNETLLELVKRYLLVTASSTPSVASRKTLEYTGIFNYFKAMYCPDTHHFTKPSAEIYRKILADFNCLRGYAVGDSVEKDLLPAKEVGLSTILFSKKTDARADYCISCFSELILICQ